MLLPKNKIILKKIEKTSILCKDKESNISENLKNENLSFIQSKLMLNPKKKYKLKPLKKKEKVSLLLLGATGDGKSQLGNFILNNPNAFKVSDDINSETKETKGEYGKNGAEELFVIDTPGLQDTEEKDKYILEQMASYVKSHNSLNAIIIVLNFEVDRLSSYIQEMLKIFIKMFPIPNFWDHVSFVFTHYYAAMIKKNEPKKQNKIEKFSDLIIELIQNFKTLAEDVQIPNKSNLRFYFVDSEMENIDERDQNSVEEINRLVGWASSLETFETDKIEKVNNKVISERYETRERQINSKWNKNIETIYFIKEKRKIEKLYCGKESFSAWEIVEKFCKEKKHKPEVIKTDKKWDTKKFSIFKKNVEYITIKHYYKIIKIYNDDTTEESEWIYSHKEEDKNVHPKKLIKVETENKKTFDEWTNSSATLSIYYTHIWARSKKIFNDDSIEYTDWVKINTLENRVNRPPFIVKNVLETKKVVDYEPISETYSERVFDYLLIFIPMYKTIYKTRTIGKKVIEKFYQRLVTYYSDGTINYGNWIYNDYNIYKEYF